MSGSAEDEARAFEDQLRGLDVAQLVLSSASTIAMLALTKLDADDLPQAQLGIEAVQALLPVLEGATDEETLRGLRAALASLQLAYADAASSTD